MRNPVNLQIRIWISNVVLFVVPILIAIILFLLYFTGLRILANAGYYLRIEQEQQFKSVSRITETITFYGLENDLINSFNSRQRSSYIMGYTSE